MSLNVSKLEKVRELGGGIVQARCPACAEGDNDRSGEHLRIYPDGRFGCCVHPKDGEHRKRIFALVGNRKPGNFSPRIQTPPAMPGAKSVKTALTGFVARTLRTPVSESVSTESKAFQPSPASYDPDSSQPELQSKYFRTLRTPFLNPRAYRKENNIPVYMCKDLEGGVLAVLTGERLPFLTAGGDLSIPFDSDPKYHWWKLGGQTVEKTRAEVLAWMKAEGDNRVV